MGWTRSLNLTSILKLFELAAPQCTLRCIPRATGSCMRLTHCVPGMRCHDLTVQDVPVLQKQCDPDVWKRGINQAPVVIERTSMAGRRRDTVSW